MAKLIINPTSAVRKEIPLGERVLTIGRDPSNDLVLTDAMVSRRHAIMEWRGAEYLLRDNNSSNGTLINGDRITGDHSLRDGDLIAIGSARILFQAKDTDHHSEVPSVVPPPAPTPKPEPWVRKACPACGNEALSSDLFCRSCGKELTAPTPGHVVCGYCKATVSLPAQYCGSCGKILLEPRRPVEPPPPPFRPEVSREPEPERAVPAPPTPGLAKTPHLPARPVGKGATRPPVQRPGRGPRTFVPTGRESPAGFWIRLAAYLIDGIVVGLPAAAAAAISTGILVPASTGEFAAGRVPIMVFVLPIVGGVVSFVLSIAYPIYFWTTRGATPGKQVLGLQVLTDRGEAKIETKRAVLRWIGYLVNSFTLGIGFLLIAFSPDKRGLHDRIAGTQVVKRL